jgi:hypothetical protein
MNVDEWGHWSDGQIAKHSGVTQNLVSSVRRQLKSDLSDDALQTYVREGEVQTMDTTTSTENPRTQQVEVRCRRQEETIPKWRRPQDPRRELHHEHAGALDPVRFKAVFKRTYTYRPRRPVDSFSPRSTATGQ